MLWNVPMAILNQGTHAYLYDTGVRLTRETSSSSSEKQEIASLMGIEI
jgi:mannose/fructose/N-acetylgalactosamine-specific phosphotransferase system component IID